MKNKHLIKYILAAIAIPISLVTCSKSQAGIPPYIQHMLAVMDTMTFEEAAGYMAGTSRSLSTDRRKGFGIGSERREYKIEDWGTRETPPKLHSLDAERFERWKEHLNLICLYQDLSHYGDLRILPDIPYEEIFGTLNFHRYIKTKEVVKTVYKEGLTPESCDMGIDELNKKLKKDPHWVDSIKMNITITYPYNIKAYKLSATGNPAATVNGTITIDKMEYNHACATLSGATGDNFVDADVIGISGNPVETHYNLGRRNPKKEKNNYAGFNEAIYGTGRGHYSYDWENNITEKYKDKEELTDAINLAAQTWNNPQFGYHYLYIMGDGNVKEIIFYIAEGYRTETLELIVPNRSDEL